MVVALAPVAQAPTPAPASVIALAPDAQAPGQSHGQVVAPAQDIQVTNPPINALLANAAYVQQVTVIVHAIPPQQPDQPYNAAAQHFHDYSDSHSECAHLPSLSDDSLPFSTLPFSTDEEAVEQLIRDVVCGAASKGASHEAIETATREAVMKLRNMRRKQHTRHKGNK